MSESPAPARVTVASLIEKLRTLPPEHDVYVMDAPDTGDQNLCILDVYEWDGMVVIGIDTSGERVDNGMGYERAGRSPADEGGA